MKLYILLISFALFSGSGYGFNTSSVFEHFIEALDSIDAESFMQRYTEKTNTRNTVQSLIYNGAIRIISLMELAEPEAKEAIFPVYIKMWNKLARILRPLSIESIKIFDAVIETIWKVRASQKLQQPDLNFVEIFSSIFIKLTDEVEISIELLEAFVDCEVDLIAVNDFVLDYLDEIAEDFPKFKIVLNEYYDIVYDLLQYYPVAEIEVYSMANILFLAAVAH